MSLNDAKMPSLRDKLNAPPEVKPAEKIEDVDEVEVKAKGRRLNK